MQKGRSIMKKAKTAYIISTVTMVLLFVGGMINYIQTGRWDADLSCIMACNTAIFVCAMEKYNKAKKTAE